MLLHSPCNCDWFRMDPGPGRLRRASEWPRTLGRDIPLCTFLAPNSDDPAVEHASLKREPQQVVRGPRPSPTLDPRSREQEAGHPGGLSFPKKVRSKGSVRLCPLKDHEARLPLHTGSELGPCRGVATPQLWHRTVRIQQRPGCLDGLRSHSQRCLMPEARRLPAGPQPAIWTPSSHCGTDQRRKRRWWR